MGKVIEVVYENGVFKPLQKVELKEGERGKVIIGDLSRFAGIIKKPKEIREEELVEALYD